MNAVFQSAFLKALGWSLLDSLWQIGMVWAIYLLVTRNNRRFTADLRHNLALISLVGSAVLFLFTFIIHLSSGHPGFAAAVVTLLFTGNYSPLPAMLLPCLSMTYLGITVFLLIRLFRQVQLTNKLGTTGLSKADPEIRVFLQELSGRMGIKKPIRIWISALVETPLTIGFWKPVILLPVAIVNHLSVKQTESIILHELYHIQRNDFLVNLVISVVDIVLFFNPFARYFRNLVQKERENRCDDMVLQFRYDPRAYAQALLTLEQARSGKSRISLAATGTSRFLLLARIKRVLTGENEVQPVSKRLVAALFAAMTIVYLIAPNNKAKTVGQPAENVMALTGSTRASGGNELVPVLFNTQSGPLAESSVEAEKMLQTESWDQPGSDEAHDESDAETGLENEIARVIVSEKIEDLVTTEAPAMTDPALISFVSEEVPEDFTINITGKPAAKRVDDEATFPYVPSRSFDYKTGRDTTLLPGKTTNENLKTTIRLSRTIEAIEELDWHRVEQKLQLAGEKINPEKLELELKKALLEIDWNSIDKDLAKGLKESNNDIAKYKNQLSARYQEFMEARQKRTDAARKAASVIVEERLNQAPRPGQQPRKVRKIVTI